MIDSVFRTAAGSRGESSFLGEGNIHRDPHMLPTVFQDVQDWRWKDDAPAGGSGLGLGDRQFSPDPLHLPLDAQFFGLEVQIVPLECQQLPTPQTSGQLQQ